MYMWWVGEAGALLWGRGREGVMRVGQLQHMMQAAAKQALTDRAVFL